ncbi:MAG: DNA polymerase IV [Acutalibacteraceae bacterium]|nr:DNA polymerase IV [Acutalibacteraceae bacterium]
MERVILHCDLNNFFASVSLLYSQTLVNEPVAVAGSVENRHGIILAKNEIAKKFGVKTAEPIWKAKQKCAGLCILPPMYDKYEEFSKKARAIYHRYTDMVEPFGMDECWLDVTGSTLLFGSGEEIAKKIKKDIKEELGLTISVGVSFNKVFAKLGSDMQKPDGLTVISKENFKEKIYSLPVSDLLYVGKSTGESLNSKGVFTIGDLTLCDSVLLKKYLGKNGIALKNSALGLDNSPVCTPKSTDRPKSIGRSRTLSHDITTRDELWRELMLYGEEIASKLRDYSLYSYGVAVTVRGTDLKSKEYTAQIDGGTQTGITLAKKAIKLFSENEALPCRSVGLRAIRLREGVEAVQTDIFSSVEKDEKEQRLEEEINEICERFGENKLMRGVLLKADTTYGPKNPFKQSYVV